MEKCEHVSKIRPAWDHSILNPEKWMCYICKTTESVWACLSCSNVACGRFNEKHALKHYDDSKHAISIEVNEKYIYCYVCDDYVMNDNAAGDLKLLRSALSAIATQKFTDIESRGRRLLRSYSHTGIIQRNNTDESDKEVTAAWHYRQRLLAKILIAWRGVTHTEKKSEHRTTENKPEEKSESSRSCLFNKRTIIPGVTGLRNLGNTCYMNSVLQVLSHIQAFRDFFLKMKYGIEISPYGSSMVTSVVLPTTPTPPSMTSPTTPSPPSFTSTTGTRSASSKIRTYERQTTVDCFQHLMSPKKSRSTKKKRSGGLNGGSSQTTPLKQQLICDVECKTGLTQSDEVSLCGELYGLFRVLWSGKWAQVSPHAFLRAVWETIPMFKGYAQHDAQEFLCELLDKVQREIDALTGHRQLNSHLLTNIFQGQLVSQVTCLQCKNISQTYELYLDLSLEFPRRYQITKQNSRVAQDICHITEMLAKFTEEEHLEGKIYACEKCNSNRNKNSGIVYTEAKKQLLINKLPPVLRLHLKRFRWSGRNHREKISTHVAADDQLDLQPFCANNNLSSIYHLFALIIHHGKGFGSGHYTAFTWNSEAESWVNCNDSRMILSPLEDVLMAQSYILFYRMSDVPSPNSPTSVSPSHHITSSKTPSQCNNSAQPSKHTLKTQYTLVPHPQSKSEPSLKIKKHSRKLRSEGKVDNCSLKADGTEVLLPLDMLDNGNRSLVYAGNGDRSSLSESSIQVVDDESSIQVVDDEVSFNFNISTDSVHVNMETSGVKRSREKEITNNIDISHTSKRAKKLCFETEMFYTKSRTPNKSGSDTVTIGGGNSKVKAMSASKDAKVETTSRAHLKRRKSTFW